MPWTAEQFRSRHAHDLTAKQAAVAARQANAMLRAGADEGTAIATSIKHAKKKSRVLYPGPEDGT